jgi:hypothetical protein
VNWGPKNEPVVTIIATDGVEQLLAAGVIETYLKQSGLTALGVIVDADENAVARWHSISARISGLFAEVPVTIPNNGLVLRGNTGPAFGAWIMPDNSSRGMLETFLLFLRPNDNLALHALSRDVVEQAKRIGAPFSSKH